MKIFFKICFAGLLIFSQAGCGAGPAPRLIDLVGQEALGSGRAPVENGAWPRIPDIGVIVYSDATAKRAAPAVRAEYLETLTRRTAEFLKTHCAVHNVAPLTFDSPPSNFSRELKAMGKQFQLSHLLLVVLSSHEQTGPEKMGEATMMTQMTGSVTENTALAEIGILQLSPYRIIVSASGTGTEILEQLDAPIGSNMSSTTTTTTSAYDILRARTGQQALDRALDRVRSVCHSGSARKYES